MSNPSLEIVVERGEGGYVGHVAGLARGAVVGQGEPPEEAAADTRSALRFHEETFGQAALAPTERPR